MHIDSCEEKVQSEGLKIISNTLSDLSWMLRDKVEGIEKQEEIALKVFQYIGSKQSIDEMVECVLEIQKKLKMKEYIKSKEEAKESENREEDLFVMFEDDYKETTEEE